jgi:hypothetical protein
MDTDLLLVEDLMLLLLDDETGTIAGEGTLYYVLGGAVLTELALREYVTADGGRTLANGRKVTATPGVAPSDPMLRFGYDIVSERPRGVQELLIRIGADLRGQVLDRLVERGFLRRETKRTLGIFRTTRLPADRPEYEAESLERVRSVLVDGVEPDQRTAALVALLSASGTLPQFYRAIPWSGAVYTRGKALESAHWAAEATSSAVTRTVAASAGGVSAIILKD